MCERIRVYFRCLEGDEPGLNLLSFEPEGHNLGLFLSVCIELQTLSLMLGRTEISTLPLYPVQ